MRIVLKGGNGEAVLCDGPENAVDRSRGPVGYGIGQTSMIDLAPGVGAASVLVLERGNLAHSIRFGISRECASFPAAILWANAHVKAIAAMKAAVAINQPTLVLSIVMTAGAYAQTFTPVSLNVVEAPQFIGATVLVNYQFTFGAWPS